MTTKNAKSKKPQTPVFTKLDFTRAPEQCPRCETRDLRKKGLRRKKRESIQRYQCRHCLHIFTGQNRKGRQYPLLTILDTLRRYYLGESSRELAARIKKATSTNFHRSTLFEWIKEYERFCAFARLRPKAIKLYRPKDFLITETFHHRQIYRFIYHQAKAELIVGDFQHSRFKRVAEFLKTIPESTRDDVFLREENRASRSRTHDAAIFTDIRTERKKNYATEITALVIETVRENKRRHELLQKFMLATDSVTVAVEVPVLYRERHSITTGHIDILQIRNGKLHVLDYKPNSKREKPYNQLLTYAQALEQATGIGLKDMKCAWFDEKDYYEFSPLEALNSLSHGRRRRAS